MIERSPQPQSDPLLLAGDSFLGECFWPSDVRQPSRFDEETNYDFNALPATFQFDPDPQGLSQTSWGKDSICSGNGGLPEHLIPIPQDPLTPSSTTSHVELNSIPIRQPIPIRKRKLDDLTSRSSTPGSSKVQSPHEPPRKKRNPYETEALQALPQGGFVPVQSQVDYHAAPNPWLPQPTPARGSMRPTPRAPSHQTMNPPFDHQLSSSHPQSQDGFPNGYQDPSNVLNSYPSFPPAEEGSQSQTYQLPLDVARPSSGHLGTAGPFSQVVSSCPPSHSGLEADPARNRFINLAMRTAMEIFRYPWCRTNPPWNKLQQMARSEATWNAWTRILPPEHTYPGPPMSSQAF
ncbi:hypothetical protein FA13DRAFT_1472740 [Coprinellus micaceus]|jgi:hypothetical protein|uniref:Uncharacterized protein n=1 Tax=Coprinellus micaceus TaxID=71717 RepID=A0A4Y7SLL5_COPMI|nr:hypothetical protein FA13DRAFT_1472740 [Coprinellus micaceus]